MKLTEDENKDLRRRVEDLVKQYGAPQVEKALGEIAGKNNFDNFLYIVSTAFGSAYESIRTIVVSSAPSKKAIDNGILPDELHSLKAFDADGTLVYMRSSDMEALLNELGTVMGRSLPAPDELLASGEEIAWNSRDMAAEVKRMLGVKTYYRNFTDKLYVYYA